MSERMKNQTPVIFGEVLFDCFEDGSRVMGGAPFNVAWNLQALGVSPLFVSRVGDDAQGRQVLELMRRWKMETAAVQVDEALSTGEVQVTFKDGEPSYEIVAPRAFDAIRGNEVPLWPCSLLYHGTLALREASSRQALVDLRGRSSARVFLDVNLRAPWWKGDEVRALVSNAAWVKLNENELRELFPGKGTLTQRAQAFLEAHELERLIVTRGAQGAFAIDHHTGLFEVVPDTSGQVVDTVGAGDAFTSVLLMGLLRDWPLPLTLERAQAFASQIVGLRGATSTSPEVYEPFVREWETTPNQDSPRL